MISIVDDDGSVREATKGLVRSLGYDVAAFASAEEFLSYKRVNDTACVVTDVQMPGLSGIELQSRLAEEGHRVPIIPKNASAGAPRRLERWASSASPSTRTSLSAVSTGP